MKVNQIVSEHKKGVRAMKYTKKTKGAVPVYGPDANNAKLKPVKPTGTVSESEVTLKPMPGAQEVDIDGKAVGTATTPAAATAIADLAKKGEFKPTDPNATATMENGDDEEDDHPSKHHFHDWLNSEDAPFDDEAGDDKKVMAKALQYLQGRVHPGDMEYHAHHMAHMYHGGEFDEAQSPFPSRNAGTPAAADAAAPAKPVQSAVYPSRNTVKEDNALLDKMLTIAGLR